MTADEPERREDATAAMPAAGGGEPVGPDDATSALPPIGADADATTAMPGQPAPPDATSVMPALGVGGWSARAEVPQYVRPPTGEPTGEPGWGGGADREPRRWWIPALLVIVLLLGVLGWGGWLLLRDEGTPAVPQPSASPSAARRSTAAPTKSAPRPSRTAAPTTAPARVAVPDVVGETRADAQRRLDAAGLSYRLSYRATDEAPSGAVVEMSPEAGDRVAPGTVVLLVVAESPTPPPEEGAEDSPVPGLS